jgi:uncharacterized protein (TIGR02598 family)
MKFRRSLGTSFSLVEVVVAIGLIGFAMIAILAFLPTGLTSNRLSAGETRAAQLARAIIGTLDSQCSTFGNVNCYGLTLDLSSLNTMPETTATNVLYASYASPNQPSISTTQSADSLYTIEMRFNNNPIASLGVDLGAGKTSLIELRVYSVARSEGPLRFIFLARNKG